jgi:hypothetical protein
MKSTVSIWIGEFQSEEKFNNYLNENYDDKGEISCKFWNDFEIDFIDNQFQEVVYFNEKLKLELLQEASYFSSFKDTLKNNNFENNNTIILAYDFEYAGKITKKNKLKFLGNFAYIKD